MPFDVHATLVNILFLVGIFFLVFASYYLINIGNSKVNDKNKIIFSLHNIKRTVVFICLILLTMFLFNKYSILWSTIVTLLISVVIAYLINPLVKHLENRGFKRSIAILIVYLVVIVFLVILGVLVVPRTANQFMNFVYRIPVIMQDFSANFNNFNKQIFENIPVLGNIADKLVTELDSIINVLQEKLFGVMANFASSAPNVLNILIRLVLVPVFAFYFLLDKERLTSGIISIVPKQRQEKFLNVCKDIDLANSQFVRGRLLMALFVGITTMIFLLIMGIDFALVIGIITCIADIIPYIGPFLGFIPAVVIALFQSPLKALIVAIAFVLIQWIENNILAPKILGSSIGMNPLVILLSLILGGGMFGVVGMIFSVPVVATLKILYKHYKDNIINFIYNDNTEN
ncbi:MAG: AI-2E family transporter [Tissierellia bacterium]|nr:AI-2E family transporter [Tissierellia bacterium]